MESQSSTPMLKQYFHIKKQYPDAILFFRMGDFYEMFFEDARIAAPILEVVLTSRNKNKKDSVPMCGIPYHARDNYVVKLLKRGFKVAICEQVEDPSLAKGIVKREVIRVLTPATALEIETGGSELNNFVVSVYLDDHVISIASIDLSASDFEVRCFEKSRFDLFLNEFYKKFPRELVIAESHTAQLDKITEHFPELSMLLVNKLPDFEFNRSECEHLLKDHFGLETIEGLGLKGKVSPIIAAGVLLKYLRSVRKTALKNISSLKFIPDENYLIMDSTSFKNLEILSNLRSGNKSGSLFEAVDFTLTPMGKRLLKKWLSYPLIEKKDIIQRLDGVDELLHNLIVRTEMRKILKDFGDLARLNSKISLNIVLPSHLLLLKQILLAIPKLKNEIENSNSKILKQCHAKLKPLKVVLKMIGEAIMDDPSNNLSEGNFIKSGHSHELDELRNISRNAKEIVSAMENTEKEQTGIPSLKIKYNKVFGYFIEVTRTHLKLIPPRYIRKQTLVNSERFITGELKDL